MGICLHGGMKSDCVKVAGGFVECLEKEKGNDRGRNWFMYNGIVVPIVLYSSEALEINVGLIKKVYFLNELPQVKQIVTLIDRMGNEDIKTTFCLRYNLSGRMTRSVMRWVWTHGENH